jgi:large subunit ribosomal protein L18
MFKNVRRELYLKRKRRIRKRILGTTERPRLTVFRSARHIYAQVIDDSQGKTLASACSSEKVIRDQAKGLKKGQLAEKVGQLVAERCLASNIQKVVFDRNGFIYHGRVAKLADGAREKGLSF